MKPVVEELEPRCLLTAAPIVDGPVSPANNLQDAIDTRFALLQEANQWEQAIQTMKYQIKNSDPITSTGYVLVYAIPLHDAKDRLGTIFAQLKDLKTRFPNMPRFSPRDPLTYGTPGPGTPAQNIPVTPPAYGD